MSKINPGRNNISTIENGVKHTPQFGGVIHYVAPSGNDSNDGFTPTSPKLTIGAAISSLEVGDAISIMAGTYTETALDVDVNACELWFEIGAIIDPASGTALTISGSYCKIMGNHIITPGAGEIGLSITGNYCRVSDGRILQGGYGIRITGTGSIVEKYACGNQTVIAYDIQGAQSRILNCNTVGAGATIGFKISGGVDIGVIDYCTSEGHTTAGFYIDTGSADWTILNCSTGHDDGKWLDVDSANVWSNFVYPETKFSEVTLTATGGAGSGLRYNLFKVIGAIRVRRVYGHIVTECANTSSTINIEIGSTNGTIDITDASGGPNIQAAPVGTIYSKNSITTDPLASADPSASPGLIENTSFKTSDSPIILAADTGADTFIQLVLSVALASGVMHWHIEWEPITNNGFLETL